MACKVGSNKFFVGQDIYHIDPSNTINKHCIIKIICSKNEVKIHVDNGIILEADENGVIDCGVWSTDPNSILFDVWPDCMQQVIESSISNIQKEIPQTCREAGLELIERIKEIFDIKE